MAFADFLFQGSPPPSVNSKVETQQGLPDWYQTYLRGLISRTNAIAGTPYQPYTGPRVAGFTTDQNNAFQMTRDNVDSWSPLTTLSQNYLTKAGSGMDPSEFGKYVSPYMEGVTNRIAQLGARNLSENLLPQVNDTFTGAGQFGSSRNEDFTLRALRDTNESIMGQQAQTLQQGYDSAMTAYQNAQNIQNQSGTQLGALGSLVQQSGLRDAAAVQAVGEQQQGLNQKNLDVAYGDFQAQRDYPMQQANYLSSIMRGFPITTNTTQTTTGPLSGAGYQPAPLSQLVGGLSLGQSLFGKARGGHVAPGRMGRPKFRVIEGGKTHRPMGGLASLRRVA